MHSLPIDHSSCMWGGGGGGGWGLLHYQLELRFFRVTELLQFILRSSTVNIY